MEGGFPWESTTRQEYRQCRLYSLYSMRAESSAEGDTRYPGGLHGVGASVVNALSNWLEVEICREGKIYKQRYERGKVMNELEIVGDCEEEKSGTKVTFLPDDTIFEETVFDLMCSREGCGRWPS